MNTDTIFALSSGVGKSGVAVIRISGDNLELFAKKLIIPNSSLPIKSRNAYFTNMRDENGALIDQCLAIYFAAPNSFTGQDMIEIQCHGASAVIQKIFNYLSHSGFRMANPGEFSKRAFYNNKMDLSEVDGLSNLLDAKTERQRQSALKSMTGSDSRIYESWRTQMIEISAYAAAILDYPSDELPENIGDKLKSHAKKLQSEIENALNKSNSSRMISSGFNIVLTGETNVGKSSLFNRMVGSARAIVSDIPGTTRDVVSSELDIDGYLVHLSDTAGIRESTDIIENIGIKKTHDEIANADLIIKVQSADNKVELHDIKDNEILVINKSDLINEINNKQSTLNTVYISSLTGDGVDDLLNIIKEKLHYLTDGAESEISVNNRIKLLLIDANNELSNALNDNNNYDIFAEHVRIASDYIGKILGTIGADEVADCVFGNLCLGK